MNCPSPVLQLSTIRLQTAFVSVSQPKPISTTRSNSLAISFLRTGQTWQAHFLETNPASPRPTLLKIIRIAFIECTFGNKVPCGALSFCNKLDCKWKKIKKSDCKYDPIS